MELVEGRTLRQLIAEGPRPLDQAIGLAKQIAARLPKPTGTLLMALDMTN
jgi:hypothetical protein